MLPPLSCCPPSLPLSSSPSLSRPDLSAMMTIKAGRVVPLGLLLLCLHPCCSAEFTGLEPLTSCALRQLMLQMEESTGLRLEMNNWSAVESLQWWRQKEGEKEVGPPHSLLFFTQVRIWAVDSGSLCVCMWLFVCDWLYIHIYFYLKLFNDSLGMSTLHYTCVLSAVLLGGNVWLGYLVCSQWFYSFIQTFIQFSVQFSSQSLCHMQ